MNWPETLIAIDVFLLKGTILISLFAVFIYSVILNFVDWQAAPFKQHVPKAESIKLLD
jgi:hypothetical protein